MVSLSKNELEFLAQGLDLEKPLIFDDVAWSGRTCLDVAALLRCNTADITFAFLAANNGTFGEGKPGAVDLLRSKQAQVEAGVMIATPQDDGFHVEDFFKNPHITHEKTFHTVLELQKAREQGNIRIIKQILDENHHELFPAAMTSSQMLEMQREGRIITPGGFPKKSLFDINPPNWLMPSFSKRVRSEMMETNMPQLISVLHEFQRLVHDEGAIKEGEIEITRRGGERL
ncbi:MAG: hypothetical protein WC489_04365 [Patescibacteria group bacterium]